MLQQGERVDTECFVTYKGGEDLLHPRVVRVAPHSAMLANKPLAVLTKRETTNADMHSTKMIPQDDQYQPYSHVVFLMVVRDNGVPTGRFPDRVLAEHGI